MLQENAKVITACTEQMKRVEDRMESMIRSNNRTDDILDDHKKLIERMHSKLDDRS